MLQKRGGWRNTLCTYLLLKICVGFLNSTASALAVVMLHRYKPDYVNKKCFSPKCLNLHSRRKPILKHKINREHWLINCIDTKAKCWRFWSGQIQRVKLRQNMVSNRTPYPPPLSRCILICKWKGGRVEPERRLERQQATVHKAGSKLKIPTWQNVSPVGCSDFDFFSHFEV